MPPQLGQYRHQLARQNVIKNNAMKYLVIGLLLNRLCIATGSVTKRFIAIFAYHTAKRWAIVKTFLSVIVVTLSLRLLLLATVPSKQFKINEARYNEAIISQNSALQMEKQLKIIIHHQNSAVVANGNSSSFNSPSSLHHSVDNYPSHNRVTPDDPNCSSNVTGGMALTFTCANIHHIKLKHMIGRGVSKQVYMGVYCGHRVAVKIVSNNKLSLFESKH